MLYKNVIIGHFIMSWGHALHVLFDQSLLIWSFGYFPTGGCWNGVYGITETGIFTTIFDMCSQPSHVFFHHSYANVVLYHNDWIFYRVSDMLWMYYSTNLQ